MKRFDIVIVGGGIIGAASAQAAAARGYTCLLLEQYSQAAQGTSCKSSKLIHGGLRYLESRQFKLVRECLRERQLLLRNAPELVRLVPFHLPIYAQTTRRPWQIRLGLMLYTLLGGKGFRTVPRTQWSQLDGLDTNGLQQVFQYWDAQTDDAALTRAVLGSARKLGANVQLNACFDKALRINDGYQIHYHQAGTDHCCETRILINASGPWVNLVLEKVQPMPLKCHIELVAGSHLLLPGKLTRGIYYLEAPADQRAVFAMPWQGNTLIGTTEVIYTGKPEDIQPTTEEIQYLLDVYNHYFHTRLTRADVIEAFAGLRVLPAVGEAAFSRSRDTVILPDSVSDPHLFSIYGGKLTAYRAMAENLMQQIKPLLPQHTPVANTRTLHIR